MEQAVEAGPTLVVTPGGRNAEVVLGMLQQAGLHGEARADARALGRELEDEGDHVGVSSGMAWP